MTDQHDPTAAHPEQSRPDVPPVPPPVRPWMPPVPQQGQRPAYDYGSGPSGQAQQPPLAYAQPQNLSYGYAQPPLQTPPPAKRGLSGGALAAIIGGGILAFVLVGLVIGFAIFSSLGNAATARDEGAGGVVEGYLAAVADGDAQRALSYIGEAPAPGPLLTDEALAVSNELAPITGITVGDIDLDEMNGRVPVTYTRGEEAVSVVYDVFDYDRDGEWEITGGTGAFEVSRFNGLGLTINDQPIDSDTIDVFPGTYVFATDLENFEITGSTTVTVTEPFEYPSLSDLEPALSETGLTLFRQVVRSAVDQCVASTALAAGCGIDLPATLDDGTQLVDGTVTRTLPVETQTTLDSLEACVGFDTPTLVQGDFIGGVDISADCTQNGASGRCDLVFGPLLEVPYVDMASEDPTVRWD